jgi:hypothetical protein
VGFAVLAAVAVHGAGAQSELGTQLWIDYNPSWSVDQAGVLFGDIGVRTDLEGWSWLGLVVRPGYGYRINRTVTIAGGVGSFYTAIDDFPNQWEIRPWQGIAISWPRAGLPLEHYVRIEQRIALDTESWDARTSLRGRYRVYTYFDWARQSPTRYWRFLAGCEAFLTVAGHQGAYRERFRLSAALERGVRAGVRVVGEVTFQRVGWLLADSTIDDLLLRVRLFHEWSR